jgi:murein biosynthesis integral membrane protein MurJ
MLLGRFGRIHSNHRRIAAGAFVIGALTITSKFFGALREMVLAWRYGISGVLDSYQLATTATTLLPTVVAGILGAVLVPRLVAVRGPDRVRFIEELNGTMLLLAVAFGLLTWVGAPYTSSLLASHARPDTLRLTAEMSARMAPMASFVILSGFVTARLQSRERFAYSISEAISAVTIILMVIMPFGPRGAAPLIIGSVVGSFLQLLLLVHMTRKGDPPLGSARVRHRSPEWSSLYRSIVLMGLGQLIFAVALPVDQGFASRLGQGAVATLAYANRILALITTFGAVVVARALLPVLSGTVADDQLELGRRQALQWSGLLGAAALLITMLLWLLAPTIVRLLFQRGAFDANASAKVAHVLRFGLLQLPFYFAALAIVQWLIANGRYGTLLIVAAIGIAFKIALNFILVPLFGLAGIMIATASMFALTFICQFVFVRVVK